MANRVASILRDGKVEGLPSGDSLIDDGGNPVNIEYWEHTFTVMGEIKVPSGQSDVIPGMYFNLPAGTAKLTKCRYVCGDGTSVTFKLQINGSDATGFTSLSCTSTAATTDPTDVTLANLDYIQAVVTAVSGTPHNLSITIMGYRYT